LFRTCFRGDNPNPPNLRSLRRSIPKNLTYPQPLIDIAIQLRLLSSSLSLLLSTSLTFIPLEQLPVKRHVIRSPD
ncbi:hypothetical protein HOY82DRAFT_591420, partial [Tuber indicum]